MAPDITSTLARTIVVNALILAASSAAFGQSFDFEGLLLNAPAAPPAAAPVAQAAGGESGGRVTLTAGEAPTVLKGTVVGRGDVTYTLAGLKGQTLVVELETTNNSLYFNVLPAGTEDALYASDRGETGNQASIELPADDDYRVQVYLFRNEARRGTKAAFTLTLSLK
jgi:hypothetical protein